MRVELLVLSSQNIATILGHEGIVDGECVVASEIPQLRRKELAHSSVRDILTTDELELSIYGKDAAAGKYGGGEKRQLSSCVLQSNCVSDRVVNGKKINGTEI